MCKRILYQLSFLLGLMGLVGCIAAIFGIWHVSGRANQASGKVFGAIDATLLTVQRRITQTQGRVQTLKVTTQDIEQSVKNWAKLEAREAVTSLPVVEAKTEQLAVGFQQVDHWLEFTESSVQLVQQALEMGSSLGSPVQTEAANHLLEELVSLRTQLTQAIEPLDRIREQIATFEEDNPGDKELARQSAQPALRVIATLSSIDSRLDKIVDRLSELRIEIRDAKTKTLWCIRIGAISITLLLIWMLAGQGSLGYLGWKELRQRRPSLPAGIQETLPNVN